MRKAGVVTRHCATIWLAFFRRHRPISKGMRVMTSRTEVIGSVPPAWKWDPRGGYDDFVRIGTAAREGAEHSWPIRSLSIPRSDFGRSMSTAQVVEDLRTRILAHYALLFLSTWEEERWES